MTTQYLKKLNQTLLIWEKTKCSQKCAANKAKKRKEPPGIIMPHLVLSSY